MKKKIFSIFFSLVLVLTLGLVMAVPAGAATPPSSTMVFHGNLTDNGDGTYSGTIPMVDEIGTELGDGVTGFDVYARNGAPAVFVDERYLVTPSITSIANHDAYPDPMWDPDVPDWNCYALTLAGNTWRLVYNNSSTPPEDWATCGGVPMSGRMDWHTMYASETDLGFCFGNPVGVAPEEPAYIGWAANHGGGPACWDMDWLWGGEVVPLQFPGFAVEITETSSYTVTLTPAAAPAAVGMTAFYIPWIGIEVDPTWADFGELIPGTPSTPAEVITVTNLGNVDMDITASIINESPPNVYTASPPGLTIDALAVDEWGDTLSVTVVPGSPRLCNLILTVPSTAAPGTYTAVLVFWAEPTPQS